MGLPFPTRPNFASMRPIIECVPNFSEGRDLTIIRQITGRIESVAGVKLLDVDPGASTNRTVVTFAGEPEPVLEAAFRAIKEASEIIDMRKHHGEHPRFGATDVCPLVPISGITMDDVVKLAHRLGKRVGEEIGIPVYFYEYAASEPKRRNLAWVRAGEYEGIAEKIAKPEWKPDAGPAKFNEKTGNIAIGARDFLVAYNVNLNTTSVRRANSVAFDIREQGRTKTGPDGKPLTDASGNPIREPGTCKGVKAIGWFIEEYGFAQVSMNITSLRETPLHKAFDECVKSAYNRGMRVTGSELVGLVPLSAMTEAGKYFLRKQQRSGGVSERELIRIAVKSMGLDELRVFDPKKKIIEYMIRDDTMNKLASMTLAGFADETASESPAPGGGSISAYVGALGVSLATMVANLSSHKKGWDDRWEEFSQWAEKGQAIKDKLLQLVDEDTQAFNQLMAAFGLPKGTDEEKTARSNAIQEATKRALEVPLAVMETTLQSFGIIKAMAETGNPNSISDAGVGALCARSAVLGAHLNVKINAAGIKDKGYLDSVLVRAQKMADEAVEREREVMEVVERGMNYL